MSAHIDGPTLRTDRLKTGKRRLVRPLTIVFDGAMSGTRIIVPAATITDFSSIPWFGRILVRWSKVDIAGVVHDWLYADQSTFTRAEADKIWRIVAGSGETRANAFQSYTGWLALRAFGGAVWKRCAKEKKQASKAPALKRGEAPANEPVTKT